MFLFILNSEAAPLAELEFKYISCSYLSAPLEPIPPETEPFKYISCSYLSATGYKVDITKYLFKYISCSYLSTVDAEIKAVEYGLNTSHVLIYPYVSVPPNPLVESLNTCLLYTSPSPRD